MKISGFLLLILFFGLTATWIWFNEELHKGQKTGADRSDGFCATGR